MARKDIQKEKKPMKLEKAEKLHSDVLGATNEAKAEAEALGHVVEKYNREIKQLDTKKSGLVSDISKLEDDFDKKTLLVSDLRANATKLVGEVAELNKEVEERHRQLREDGGAIVQDLKNDIATLEEQKKSAEKKVTEVLLQQKNVENDLTDTEKSLSDKKSEYKSLTEEVERIKTVVIPELQATIEKMEDSIRNLEVDKAQRMAESAGNKSIAMELIRSAEKLKSLQEEITTILAQRDSIKAEFEPKLALLNAKIDQNTELEKSIDAKIEKYKKMTTKVQTEATISERLSEEAPQ